MSSKTMKVLKVQDSSIHLTFQISEKLIKITIKLVMKHNKIHNLVYYNPKSLEKLHSLRTVEVAVIEK